MAAAMAGVGFHAWQSNRAGTPLTLLTQALPDAAGHVQSFSQWRGKILVVNFWATWCAPCREEIPLFVRLQQQYAARGLQFVGVAIDQADKVAPFARDLHINYPVLIGGIEAMEWARELGNRNGALPYTVIADRHGAVLGNHLGVMTEPMLFSVIGASL